MAKTPDAVCSAMRALATLVIVCALLAPFAAADGGGGAQKCEVGTCVTANAHDLGTCPGVGARLIEARVDGLLALRAYASDACQGQFRSSAIGANVGGVQILWSDESGVHNVLACGIAACLWWANAGQSCAIWLVSFTPGVPSTPSPRCPAPPPAPPALPWDSMPLGSVPWNSVPWKLIP
jgi:hypothetical protein